MRAGRAQPHLEECGPLDVNNHALEGGPETSFQLRNLGSRRWLVATSILDYFSLAFTLSAAALLCVLPPFEDPLAVWRLPLLGSYAAAQMACLVWRRRAHATPASGCASCLELTSLIMRLAWLSTWEPLPLQVTMPGTAAKLLGDAGSAQSTAELAAGGLALTWHAVELLVASSTLCMLLQVCRPMRLSLSIPVQLLLALHCARRAPAVCASAHLSHPGAQQLTRALFSRLSNLNLFSPLPVLGLEAELDAAAQCAATLRFTQLTLGVLLPLAWQAVSEARLFGAHQRQRLRARLPPEHGFQAGLYQRVLGVSEEPVLRPFLWLLAGMGMGVCWDLTAVLSAGHTSGAAAAGVAGAAA